MNLHLHHAIARVCLLCCISSAWAADPLSMPAQGVPAAGAPSPTATTTTAVPISAVTPAATIGAPVAGAASGGDAVADCKATLAIASARYTAGNALIAAADWQRGRAGMQGAEGAALAATTACTGDDAALAAAKLTDIRAILSLVDQHEQKLKQCVPLTDQAVSADIKAAVAQSQKKELQEIARLYDDATRLWTSALDACEGKDKERARRNLADTTKARDAVALMQGAGLQCESSNRDAAAMHELARQASIEKRWAEAAIYFRKTANMWDMAGERCSGPQATLAQTRREQATIDAHNAEVCAPLFEVARDKLQAFKAAEGSMMSPVKQDLSRAAEVQWRVAASQCRGGAAEVALANAQRLAKERGTPLPAGMVPVVAEQGKPMTAEVAAAAAAPTARSQGAAPTNTAVSSAPSATIGKQKMASTGVTTATPMSTTAPVPQQAALAAPAMTPAAGQPTERVAGTTRLIGQFKSGPDGAMLNGFGKVIWENGSTFEGAMVDGARTGKGKFVWPSGQSFDGEWRNDTPMGAGILTFANGDRYEGNVVDGTPNGSGKMQYAHGDSYAGEFRNGQPEGKGTFIWKNGNRYTGQWASGLRQGTGVYTWSNGDQWIGEFNRDQQTDNGKLVRRQAPTPKDETTSKS